MICTRKLCCSLPTIGKLLKCNQFKSIRSVLQNHTSIGYVNNQNFSTRFQSTAATVNAKQIENVYYGLLTPKIKAVKFISFTTSIGSLIAQPILVNHISSAGGSLAVVVGLCTFFGFFTVVTPVLLHMVTRSYITHLDFNAETQKYIATVFTFFCMKEKIEFSVDDVKIPEVPGMFTTFKVKNRALFVEPSLFVDPTHYGKIMGYDKPIDFKLYTEPPPSNPVSKKTS